MLRLTASDGARCALHGWHVTDVQTLSCGTCNAHVIFERPGIPAGSYEAGEDGDVFVPTLQAAEVRAEMYTGPGPTLARVQQGAHAPDCSWFGNPCPLNFLTGRSDHRISSGMPMLAAGRSCGEI